MRCWKPFAEFWKNRNRLLRVLSAGIALSFLAFACPTQQEDELIEALTAEPPVQPAAADLPSPRPFACGTVDRRFKGYSFLDPAIIDPTSAGASFFLPFQEIYEKYGRQNELQPMDNLSEWRDRFCKNHSLGEIAYVIYKTSASELEQLRTAAASNSIPIYDSRLKANSFARHLERHACLEVIDYLIFAKRCEPHVTIRDPWKTLPRDVEAMQRLIEEGKETFLRTESHYVRLRYAYQLVRLAHYARQYQQVLDLYDYLMPKIDNDPSIIEYWIMGHKAGALMGLKRNVEAAYLYSRIFENCPSKRESAFRSFRINSDEEWHQCLLLCETDQQRATLYALRANAQNSKAVEEMEKIYELDPTSAHLEPLLVQEIAKLEKDLLGLPFNDNRQENRRYHNIPRPNAGDYVIRLLSLVRKILDDRLVERPALWKIAEGYLELLAGNYYEATQTFRDARQMADKKILRDQLEVFELALQISAFSRVDDAMEQRASEIQRENKWYNRLPDLRDFLSDKLASLYQDGGHPGKAFLHQYDLSILKGNPREDVLEDLLAICRKENPTRLERDLINESDGTTIKEELLDMKATLLMSRFQPGAAIESLKEMDRIEWDRFGRFNPFIERLNDCVHCPIPLDGPRYNRGELIERLTTMEYNAQADLANSDTLFFQLGLAYYNMTYFSFAWEAMDYFRSGTSLLPANLRDGDNIVPYWKYPLGNRENFDCSKALFYFEQAIQHAREPELAAKATFWAAKCERNAYYIQRYQGAQQTFRFFESLKQHYSGTEFYNRAIKECKYFAAYATK